MGLASYLGWLGWGGVAWLGVWGSRRGMVRGLRLGWVVRGLVIGGLRMGGDTGIHP